MSSTSHRHRGDGDGDDSDRDRDRNRNRDRNEGNDGDDGGANQIEVPPSFLALYADARRPQRLREPIAHVRARYEICEDLAGHLTEHARLQLHAETASEAEVLRRILAGLRAPAAGLHAGEARWVVTRLAELLEWRAPDMDGDGDGDGDGNGNGNGDGDGDGDVDAAAVPPPPQPPTSA